MLTEQEARKVAQKVVDAAKGTAHVDTGALRRSISYTYVNGVVIFRQLYYGVYNENSQLEKYARRYMPFDQPWKVILTAFNGSTMEVGKTQGGFSIRNLIKKVTAYKQTTSNIRNLLNGKKTK